MDQFELLSKKKYREIGASDLIDTWLKTYHGVTLQEIEDNYTKDENGEYTADETRRFYQDYAVTQEQHDEWDNKIRKLMKNKSRLSQKRFDRSWAFVYLNVAPSVKQEE